jgi:ferredoxin-thioredoxin reductase catalytic subunit
MKYFIKEGWILNPNEKIVKSITKAIERNDGKCPCAHDEDFNGDLHCPYEDYRIHNQCCCQLYIKEN